MEQRWAAELAPFNFSIEYRAGRSNANADALSRQTHGTAEELTDYDDDDVQQICAVHAARTLLPSKVRGMMCTEAVPCLVKTDDEPSADLASLETVSIIETNQQDVSLVQQGEATPAFPSLTYAELGELQNKDEDLGIFL